MKLCMITLGCPKNLVDSEYLLGALGNNQIQLVPQADEADVVIINTCGFILPAREEAIETILEAVQLKAIGKVQQVYVAGCLPQRYLTELQQSIPEVDAFFDQYDFRRIGQQLAQRWKLPVSGQTIMRVLQTPDHYAYLKIAEGCDNRCHYCTIPAIKGSYREWPVANLIEEAQQLAERGVRELILVAQDTTYYGWKQNQPNLLVQLIHAISKIESIQWIRLLYAHPARMNDSIFRLYNECAKLCRYIDLPIQHISDPMLRAMGRMGTGDEIRRVIDRLRREVPEIAIRTTVMVGYPGESKADFELLRQFIEEAQFERLGVFQFYAEEGTPAARLPDQIAPEVKQERYEEIMELQADISEQHNQQLVGRTLPVIIDERNESSDEYFGRTQWDAPQIDNTVHIIGDLKIGQIYSVGIERATEYDLWGEVSS
ncbi:MAG: 30S ribosomal protein S12 methylthiotransferase RimO [candidate division KSB1 bacterium]|nr:30S ribosomal protein S12 methylthiotransferase RimO [candidate division KSB1 bacterium]MDZ7399986.1 30S ribosomal protein S12 methylthiotransferase RimO [candidate division KSB1 bacterium]